MSLRQVLDEDVLIPTTDSPEAVVNDDEQWCTPEVFEELGPLSPARPFMDEAILSVMIIAQRYSRRQCSQESRMNFDLQD